MARGTVKWFSEKKGFGFIVDPEVPTDIFVHYSQIQTSGFRTLDEGEVVEYELFHDEKGAKARNVARLGGSDRGDGGNGGNGSREPASPS